MEDYMVYKTAESFSCMMACVSIASIVYTVRSLFHCVDKMIRKAGEFYGELDRAGDGQEERER